MPVEEHKLTSNPLPAEVFKGSEKLVTDRNVLLSLESEQISCGHSTGSQQNKLGCLHLF